ncbi:tail completion protein gp17 [Paracoccus laeviglucosivorans]|uniref:DUF3168 domain-containing protein n=1 Tax=Paracoccus laeviglucosivorans TaxID=1197861 RepID=A0A521CX90_9RHOB|nr:DUF3168 domain-containing protein [Paracoccus laeviglucosivorans]SMO64065.1 Protein of unknown function [Paracoccus laeviglucosivorans]
MEEEFLALLRGSAALTAIVAADRINWGEVPQGQRPPAIVLHLISNEDGLTQQGSDALWQSRVQVDVYDLTFGGATIAARRVRDVLHCFSGGNFQLITQAQQRSNKDQGAVDRPYWISMDFITNWRDANA